MLARRLALPSAAALAATLLVGPRPGDPARGGGP
jgi:hypothetical protein